MDQLLTNFIRALRNADVRVSTAETLDALGTVKLVGYSNRQLLKDSLGLVLPKTQEEKATFEACFDRFFTSSEHSSDARTDSRDAGETSQVTSGLGQLLASANSMAISAAINTAGQQVRIHQIEMFTQKGV